MTQKRNAWRRKLPKKLHTPYTAAGAGCGIVFAENEL